MGVKIINTLYCVLSKSEFNIIKSYKNAKDIWHALEVTHKWTNEAKKSKIDMLIHQYELFKILHYEP